MLQLNRINKSFGHNQVLQDVTFNLSDGEHAALVGGNGSGKSTLFEIIASKLQPDSGSVVTGNGEFIGYLPQNPLAVQAETVADALLLAINQTQPYPSHELSAREEADALKLMSKLGLGYLALSTPLKTLSGGEGTRIQLAALLLQRPEILLLDEPTISTSLPWNGWRILSTPILESCC